MSARRMATRPERATSVMPKRCIWATNELTLVTGPVSSTIIASGVTSTTAPR